MTDSSTSLQSPNKVAGVNDPRDAEVAVADVLGLRRHPGDDALAVLADRLMAHGAGLADGAAQVPAADRTARTAHALTVWARLKATTPATGPAGLWAHTFELALVVRDLHAAAVDRERAQREAEQLARLAEDL